MIFGAIYYSNLIPNHLIIGSINAFGIIWSGIIWMIAGFIAGVLAAIPICAIFLSYTNLSQQEGQDILIRIAIFVVGMLTLLGLLVGAYQELIKQTQREPYGYLPENVREQSHLISEVMPTEHHDY